ncbi:MAG: chromosomal replication initiator protein DnaA, partial [Melioribacteraceae bacterium]|nr:chromosomal replication initiator protein DnaA [Melioribacteraceae bacterium]
MEVNEKETPQKISSTEIWKKCLSVIKENVPALTYSTWFIPIKPIEYINNSLKIEVPNTFFIEWIEEHYNTIINNVVNQILGNDGKLLYVVLDEQVANLEMTSIIDEPQIPEVVSTIQDEVRPEFESYLMPRYKFDNFIKGEG